MVTQCILMVGNYLSRTGFNPTAYEFLPERLQALGWGVIVTSHKLARLPRVMDMVSVTWSKRHMYSLAQVDVYSGPAFLWAELVCGVLRLVRKPYILTLHGGRLPTFALRWPRRVRRLLHSAVVVVVPSHYLLERMQPYRPDLRLLPNPIDISLYAFEPRRNPRPRLVWLRAFHRIYNPTLAPKVVARLTQEFPDVHLTMVGPDKGDGSFQETQRLAAQLGVDGRITSPGGVPKAAVPEWIGRGDIFLNTTNVDNTPVSVMEAMACGLCIVSTDVGGIPYLLEHERDALLVPAGDADAMASAVRRVLTEPGLAERLSRNARRKAEQYDWSAVLPQWEELLSSAAGADD